MVNCCEDPTEPKKLDIRDLHREQERYGSLLRDLFTEDPEKLMLKQLKTANTYIRELAALRAHFPTVRSQAIELLEKESIGTLERIVNREAETDLGKQARKRIESLCE